MKWLCVIAISRPLSAPALAQERPHFDVRFSDTIITAGPDALAAGDRIILNDTLLDGGIDVGRIHGTCTITDPKGFAICTVTFMLPDGTPAL
jgi:hypothetical protein